MEIELIETSARPRSDAAGSAGDRTSPADDDVRLAERILEGDRDAFDRFYTENVGRVHALMLRFCGEETRARRLTQHAFVRAWERLHTYRGESRLSSWLHRLATNVAIESGRRRSRWWGRLVTVDAAPERRDHGAEDPALRLDLERAIAALPERARQALVLRDVEGHSYAEIARLTGTAVGTVKAQVHRARRLLRERLDR